MRSNTLAQTMRSDTGMSSRSAIPVKPTDPTWLAEIERALRVEYGQPRHHNPKRPLDDLVFLVLSRMTQEVKYVRTYRALKRRFPNWQDVLNAPDDVVEAVLRDAGLAFTKTQQIKKILLEVKTCEGRLSLARLNDLDDETTEQYLTSLPGVSIKTARCVMLYALNRSTFPVDTHVWRIARRLQLTEDRPWASKPACELQEHVPRSLRGSLHMTLVAHGRAICTAARPRCTECVIARFCPSAEY
jgi:endonuclease III